MCTRAPARLYGKDCQTAVSMYDLILTLCIIGCGQVFTVIMSASLRVYASVFFLFAREFCTRVLPTVACFAEKEGK